MSEWALFVRVLLAAGLSAAIGIEREFHGRPAGLRTHLLVGTGSALVIVAFLAAWQAFVGGDPETSGLPAELGRLAAGAITGIGFLGAGTIIKVGDWVRGLTTAASLWFVAALGITCGLGTPVLAASSAGVGLMILAVVDPLAARIPSRAYQTLTLTVRADRSEQVQDELPNCCVDRRRTRITLVGWEWDSHEGFVTLTYRIRHTGTPHVQKIAASATKIDGVIDTKIKL